MAPSNIKTQTNPLTASRQMNQPVIKPMLTNFSMENNKIEHIFDIVIKPKFTPCCECDCDPGPLIYDVRKIHQQKQTCNQQTGPE